VTASVTAVTAGYRARRRTGPEDPVRP